MMKKTFSLVSLMYLSMYIVSCADTSLDEATFSTKKVGDKIIINQQKNAHLRKDNISKVAQKVIPEVNKKSLSSTENTKNADLEMNLGPEPPLLFNPLENTTNVVQEQDTGVPLDPDNEDDVYLISPSSDDIDTNEEQDTGVFLDPDL